MGMKPVPSFSTFDRRSVWRFTVSKVLSGFCWEWAKEDRRGDGREIARVFRRPSSLFNGDIALLCEFYEHLSPKCFEMEQKSAFRILPLEHLEVFQKSMSR